MVAISNVELEKKLPRRIYNPEPDLFEGPVRTRSNNMIINNDNISADGIGYTRYYALSYVSSGSRYHNNIFQIEADNGQVKSYSTRYSNDRLKYKSVMETFTNQTRLWTDCLSIEQDNNNLVEQMVNIGTAYKIADSTLVILDKEDEKFMNTLMDEVDIYALCFVALENNKDDTLMKDYVHKSSYRINNMNEIAKCRREFSYWSRIWTLQEQHLSQNIQYGCINDKGKYVTIVTSSQLINYLMIVSKMVKLMKDDVNITELQNDWLIYKTHESIVWRLLTGIEKVMTANSVGQSGADIDTVLIEELILQVKCARNFREMKRAISIAMGIYTDNEEEQWHLILQKFALKGYIPVKKFFGVKTCNSWYPEETNMIRVVSGLDICYSVVFTHFIFATRDIRTITAVSNDKSLIIKARLYNIIVLETRDFKPCLIIMDSIVLKSHNKWTCDVTLQIVDEQTSIILSGYAACEYKIVAGMSLKVLVVGRQLIIIGNRGTYSTGSIDIKMDSGYRNLTHIINIDNKEYDYYIFRLNVSHQAHEPTNAKAAQEVPYIV